MIKIEFFSNKLIQSYLNEFSKNLNALPTDIKNQHIEEVKCDLYENALEKFNNGINSKEIPEMILREYLSPKKLANEILGDYDIINGNK
ncbi:hypothetical protein CN514_24775, partial [Bacillus sp. AFS001701]